MSRPAQKPVSFTIDNPARIALDFQATRNGGVERNQNIGVGMVKSMHVVQASGRTRVIFNLTHMVPYQSRVVNNRVYVTLQEAGFETAVSDEQPAPPAVTEAAVPSEQPAPSAVTETAVRSEYPTSPPEMAAAVPVAPKQPEPMAAVETVSPAPIVAEVQQVTTIPLAPFSRPAAVGPGIVNVDFRRSEQGGGRVMVTLSDPSIPVDVKQKGELLLVEFMDSALPLELERRLDVVDFATPVRSIETRKN
jgi:type IV pilus assembly protein PilQ